MAWSYVLDYENLANPFDERREVIGRWKSAAAVDVDETVAIVQQAHAIAATGVRAKDALHVASPWQCNAISSTTDERLVRRIRGFSGIIVMDPTQFVIEVE